MEACCVIFGNVLSKKKSVEFIEGRGELAQYIKMFYELLGKEGALKLACINVFCNIGKNSECKITESLNNAAKSYAMSKNTKVYESIIDRVDGSNEIIIAHVNLFNDIIQDCGDEAQHEAQLVYWLTKIGYASHI